MCQGDEHGNHAVDGLEHSVELLRIRESCPALRLATVARSAAGGGAERARRPSLIPLYRLELSAARRGVAGAATLVRASCCVLRSRGCRSRRDRDAGAFGARLMGDLDNLAAQRGRHRGFALCLLRRPVRRWPRPWRAGRRCLYSDRDRAAAAGCTCHGVSCAAFRETRSWPRPGYRFAFRLMADLARPFGVGDVALRSAPG